MCTSHSTMDPGNAPSTDSFDNWNNARRPNTQTRACVQLLSFSFTCIPHLSSTHSHLICPDFAVCMVFEWCAGGTLRSLIYSKQNVRQEQQLRIAVGVTSALTFLHTAVPAIIHRSASNPLALGRLKESCTHHNPSPQSKKSALTTISCFHQSNFSHRKCLGFSLCRAFVQPKCHVQCPPV